MIYKYNEIVSAKALSDLRESVGWNRMENEYENPLMTSYYHISIYDNNKLIGYNDCVSNGVTDAYIQDLMVHPDYQGNGIGTELMNKMIMYLKEKCIYMISVVFEESLASVTCTRAQKPISFHLLKSGDPNQVSPTFCSHADRGYNTLHFAMQRSTVHIFQGDVDRTSLFSHIHNRIANIL